MTSLSILKQSDNRKRFDIEVTHAYNFGFSKYIYSLRILAYEPLDDKQCNIIVKDIDKQIDEWYKKADSGERVRFSFNKYAATAFVAKSFDTLNNKKKKDADIDTPTTNENL